MVLHAQPAAVVLLDAARWQSVQQDVLFDVQRYQFGGVGKAFRSLASSFLTGDTAVKEYRLVTSGKPCAELAAADSLEEITLDANSLRRCMVGAATEGAAEVSPAIRQALLDSAGQASREQEGGSAPPAAAAQWSPETLRQLEPWAVSLLENADRMRYVCYALKIASTLGAEVSTGGFAGEELLQLSFAAVDAALVSSWMTWFMRSLTDEEIGDSVVRRVMSLEFAGGPDAIVAQADGICTAMRPEDTERVTKMAMVLKRRISVVVGDIIAVLVPNDASLSGALITELLIHLRPVDALQALRKLIEWYAMIPARHRASLQDREQLIAMLAGATAQMKAAILEEYDKPLSSKAVGAIKRQSGVVAANLALGLTPLGPLVGAMAVANLAGSAAVVSNAGRTSCTEVFDTLEGKMPLVADTLQKTLAMSFGVLVLLAACAK